MGRMVWRKLGWLLWAAIVVAWFSVGVGAPVAQANPLPADAVVLSNGTLYRMDGSGTLIDLTSGFGDLVDAFDLSSDGWLVAYRAWASNYRILAGSDPAYWLRGTVPSDLYVLDLRTGVRTVIAEAGTFGHGPVFEGAIYHSPPTFSPDSRYVAYLRTDYVIGREATLLRYDTATGSTQTLGTVVLRSAPQETDEARVLPRPSWDQLGIGVLSTDMRAPYYNVESILHMHSGVAGDAVQPHSLASVPFNSPDVYAMRDFVWGGHHRQTVAFLKDDKHRWWWYNPAPAPGVAVSAPQLLEEPISLQREIAMWTMRPQAAYDETFVLIDQQGIETVVSTSGPLSHNPVALLSGNRYGLAVNRGDVYWVGQGSSAVLLAANTRGGNWPSAVEVKGSQMVTLTFRTSFVPNLDVPLVELPPDVLLTLTPPALAPLLLPTSTPPLEQLLPPRVTPPVGLPVSPLDQLPPPNTLPTIPLEAPVPLLPPAMDGAPVAFFLVQGDIYTWYGTHRAPVRIMNSGYADEMAVSPDGRIVAFRSWASGYVLQAEFNPEAQHLGTPPTVLRLVDVATGRLTYVAGNEDVGPWDAPGGRYPNAIYLSGPTFSPDGRYVAWIETPSTLSLTLRRYDTLTGAIDTLATNVNPGYGDVGLFVHTPAWGPHGITLLTTNLDDEGINSDLMMWPFDLGISGVQHRVAQAPWNSDGAIFYDELWGQHNGRPALFMRASDDSWWLYDASLDPASNPLNAPLRLAAPPMLARGGATFQHAFPFLHFVMTDNVGNRITVADAQSVTLAPGGEIGFAAIGNMVYSVAEGGRAPMFGARPPDDFGPRNDFAPALASVIGVGDVWTTAPNGGPLLQQVPLVELPPDVLLTLTPPALPPLSQLLPTATPTQVIVAVEQAQFVPGPAPTGVPNPACPNSPPTRLVSSVGGYARVIPGDPNNIRQEASPSSARLGNISGGATFELRGGPQCGTDGRTWWYVFYNGVQGWTAEGDGATYWLEPLN